jgi:hypothetical protein
MGANGFVHFQGQQLEDGVGRPAVGRGIRLRAKKS